MKRTILAVATLVSIIALLFGQMAFAGGASLSIRLGGDCYEGHSYSISWNKVDDAIRYELSLRDLTLDELCLNHKNICGICGYQG